MSDESLWALANWLHAFTDATWMAYKALVVVAVVAFVALIIAEIVNLYR